MRARNLPQFARDRAGRLFAVLVDEEAGHGLGALRGFTITLGTLDDRALHQDVPRERKRGRVAETRLLGEGVHDRADVLEVEGARARKGVVIAAAELEQDVDERTALEVVT